MLQRFLMNTTRPITCLIKYAAGLSAGLFLIGVQDVIAADTVQSLFQSDRVVYQSAHDKKEYRLALGELKNINGVWQTEKESRLIADVASKTIELSSVYSVTEAWSRVERIADSLKGQVLFECDGLDCGSSNAWANNRFKIKQLYGLDPSQRYAVWQYFSGGKKQYLVAYAVQRGNKRIYLQLDTLTTERTEKTIPSTNVISKQLAEQGYYVLAGDMDIQNETWMDSALLEVVVKVLQKQVSLNVVIVGHDGLPGSAEEQMDRSRTYASKVADLLIENRISRRRIAVEGVGALAPEGKVGKRHVVLVVSP